MLLLRCFSFSLQNSYIIDWIWRSHRSLFGLMFLCGYAPGLIFIFLFYCLIDLIWIGYLTRIGSNYLNTSLVLHVKRNHSWALNRNIHYSHFDNNLQHNIYTSKLVHLFQSVRSVSLRYIQAHGRYDSLWLNFHCQIIN